MIHPGPKLKMRLFFTLLFALSAPVFSAQPPSTRFKIYEVGSCQFYMHNYKPTKPVEAAIVFGISNILETYKDTFKFPFPDDFKVKLVIFNDKASFLAYQKSKIGKVISQSGYYSGMDRETVVWKNKDVKTMIGILFHEASHMMLRYQIPWCPNWVNEGLSVYFQGLNVIGKNKRVDLEKNRHAWCLHWLKKGFPISIKDYLALDHENWMKLREKDSNAAYTIGYSLTYYMMSHTKTKEVLKKILWQCKKDAYKVDSIAIINENFPGGVDHLERTWKKWLPRARPYRPLKALRKSSKKK